MTIPVDVLRGAVPSTFPSDAERRISTPDTTTTMTGISMDNLSSFPRPDREPTNQLHVIPEGNSVRGMAEKYEYSSGISSRTLIPPTIERDPPPADHASNPSTAFCIIHPGDALP
ncbi:hypothetical protein EV421DRAFT_1735969 [Armillaria borealis]|uniref:Uncharacterized protein n=1 Tax=Armillaria borealis TaxID=47425 RepID=A0AA39JJG8_9AGAR|nr:hypothetical protein EV421DRAFT_1735969 [Armillaria borealis]